MQTVVFVTDLRNGIAANRLHSTRTPVPIAGIYGIEDGAGSVYVGQAVDVHHRWLEHLSDLRSGRHVNRRMQIAWNDHGRWFDFQLYEAVVIGPDPRVNALRLRIAEDCWIAYECHASGIDWHDRVFNELSFTTDEDGYRAPILEHDKRIRTVLAALKRDRNERVAVSRTISVRADALAALVAKAQSRGGVF